MLISGYCHEPDRITPLIQAGRAREVVSLGGNFVAVHATGPEVWIITSPVWGSSHTFIIKVRSRTASHSRKIRRESGASLDGSIGQ